MQYIKLKAGLRDFTVFSILDIKKMDPLFHRRRLNEWQEKGYIKKIIKGFYIFSDVRLNKNSLFETANRIYAPSYVSFEMALSYYGLIPESVYGITSASTRRTYLFKTELAEFSYRTLRPGLFFGYELLPYDNKNFKIAAVEKAILDYFYINPAIESDEDFSSLRIDKKVFSELIDEDRLRRFLKRFQQKALTKRVRNFLEFMKHA